jgi:hypothetical protein
MFLSKKIQNIYTKCSALLAEKCMNAESDLYPWFWWLTLVCETFPIHG